MQKDSLGDRMKRYEKVSKYYLMRRNPVIIRIDGKSFHTFTRGFRRPFDDVLRKSMQETMKYLCENIQGCVFGYTQSDEITLILTDYATLTTDAWFGYSVQKMCSIAASMATMAFNKIFLNNVQDFLYDCCYDEEIDNFGDEVVSGREEDYNVYGKTYMRVLHTAIFDARVFSLPKEEVCNCLIWRQQDAIRNSIQLVGQTYFSHKSLNRKTCKDIKEMLFKKYNIAWDDLPIEYKRGSCCFKVEEKRDYNVIGTKVLDTITTVRNKWIIDKEPPDFVKSREYIEQWI